MDQIKIGRFIAGKRHELEIPRLSLEGGLV